MNIEFYYTLVKQICISAIYICVYMYMYTYMCMCVYVYTKCWQDQMTILEYSKDKKRPAIPLLG